MRDRRRSDDRGTGFGSQLFEGAEDSATVRRRDFGGAGGVQIQNSSEFHVRRLMNDAQVILAEGAGAHHCDTKLSHLDETNIL